MSTNLGGAEPRARDISLQYSCVPATRIRKRHTFTVRKRTPEERYAAASYAANWGPASETINLDATPLASRGVFFRNSSLRVSAVMDGLANTLAFGERHNGPIPQSQPTAGGHTVFENSWIAAVRDIDELSDDHAHMVLFETQFRPNQLDGDDKGLAAPHTGLCHLPCAMAPSGNHRTYRRGSLRRTGDAIRQGSYRRLLAKATQAG